MFIVRRSPDILAPLGATSLLTERQNEKPRSINMSSLLDEILYRNFNVDKLNNANKIASIKNRKTIFDSFQSCISK